METHVLKIGGSVLRGSHHFQSIIDLTKSYNSLLVIVVSAFYGQTNLMLDLISSKQTPEQVQTKLKGVSNELWQIMNSYHPDFALKYWHKIADRFSILESFKDRLSEKATLSQGEYNFILSFGERLSSLLLSYLFKFNNLECEERLPENIGLIGKKQSGNFVVDYKSTRKNLQATTEFKKITIIPGYYGLDHQKEIVTFGRGGTDYSAAAIAYCIKAKTLDIWKDVSGFMTTDPRLVEEATNVEQLSYQEAAELAYFGAEILHQRTVEPAQLGKIPIRIYDIHQPYQSQYKTIISESKPDSYQVIKSISCSDDFSILQLQGAGIGIEVGLLGKICHLLAKGGINVKSVITAQTSINILLSNEDIDRARTICRRIKGNTIAAIRSIQQISLLAAIGEGITTQPGIASRIFGALAKKQINVSAISFGASRVAIYFIVDRKDKAQALESIHHELFHIRSSNGSPSKSFLERHDFEFHA